MLVRPYDMPGESSKWHIRNTDTLGFKTQEKGRRCGAVALPLGIGVAGIKPFTRTSLREMNCKFVLAWLIYTMLEEISLLSMLY